MRLFVAIEIPPEIQLELERRVLRVRSVLPKARWVKPGGMHLTLVFLGETDAERLPDLHRELAVAFATGESLAIKLVGAGAFPTRGRKRVVWTGVEAAGDLGGLQARVAEAVERTAGIEPERRPYHPHLTLARCKPAWPPAAAERMAASFGDQPAGSFVADHGSLMASELLPSGARYRTVETYSLGGAS